MKKDKDQDYIGMSAEDATTLAKTRNLRIRESVINGLPQYGTADADPNRVNVSVVDGKIVEVFGRG